MKENGTNKQIKNMEKDVKFGQMVASMKGIGRTIHQTAEDDLFKMIWLMDLENILIMMKHYMKENGSMISNMVKEKNNGQTVQFMRVSINTVKKKDMANLTGQTHRHFKVNLWIIIFMG